MIGIAAVLGSRVGAAATFGAMFFHEWRETARQRNRARDEAYVEALGLLARPLLQPRSSMIALEHATEIDADTPDIAHAGALLQLYGTEKIRLAFEAVDRAFAELWPALDVAVRATRSKAEPVSDAEQREPASPSGQ